MTTEQWTDADWIAQANRDAASRRYSTLRPQAGQHNVTCARCGTVTGQLQAYGTASGRVCRSCLPHVELFLEAGATMPKQSAVKPVRVKASRTVKNAPGRTRKAEPVQVPVAVVLSRHNRRDRGGQCERCGQTFRFETGRAWHMTNRPDCKAQSVRRAERMAS